MLTWSLVEFSSSGAVGRRVFVLSRHWLEAAAMPCRRLATASMAACFIRASKGKSLLPRRKSPSFEI